MSDSNNGFITVPGTAQPPKDHGMKHQIRMEMTLAAEAGRVNVAKVVAEVVSRANSGLMQVRFFDVNDVPFTGATVPSGRESITRLAVEKVERGKTRKMVMGFLCKADSI
jgi:hypothetical protein